MSAATLAKLSARLNHAAGQTGRLPSVLLLTDQWRLPDPLPSVAALPPGAGVILRHYDDVGRERLGLALRRLCRRRGLWLLIAGDWRLAARLGADGVHLPERQVGRGVPPPRRPDWLVTAAAHSRAALWRAARAGADAALLSPVFATASHPEATVLGPLRFAALAGAAPLPVYALGGVDALTGKRLNRSGAAGLAAISGLRV